MRKLLGDRLKELRGDKGYSVRDVASRIDASPGYISRIEVRGEIPSAELLCTLADLYGVDPQHLLQLAKQTQLKNVERLIDQKHGAALTLYRTKKP